MSQDGDTGLITVIPTTGPQEAGTEGLVRTLRDDVIPTTGIDGHVGGMAALAGQARSRMAVCEVARHMSSDAVRFADRLSRMGDHSAR